MLWYKYEVGDFFSADQFIVKNDGFFPSGYAYEVSHLHFHGWTICLDAATGIIWIENQVYLGAGDNAMANIRLEEWLCEQASTETKHLHSDNGVFTADMFRKYFQEKGKLQFFCGVGAQHQYSQADHNIQTIMYMACTFMSHISFNWSGCGVDDIFLWYFGINYAARL